jgi:hypothetical protein
VLLAEVTVSLHRRFVCGAVVLNGWTYVGPGRVGRWGVLAQFDLLSLTDNHERRVDQSGEKESTTDS